MKKYALANAETMVASIPGPKSPKSALASIAPEKKK
jgi:hypothetical protein